MHMQFLIVSSSAVNVNILPATTFCALWMLLPSVLAACVLHLHRAYIQEHRPPETSSAPPHVGPRFPLSSRRCVSTMATIDGHAGVALLTLAIRAHDYRDRTEGALIFARAFSCIHQEELARQLNCAEQTPKSSPENTMMSTW